MTIAELIAALQRTLEKHPKASTFRVFAEGCDCASEVVGVSLNMDPGWPCVYVRVEHGACTYDGLEMIK